MTAPAAVETADALERLIHQFSDPLSFFRELIQNAIDAGTPEIDVAFSYQQGVMTISVDDYGEGMDRRIIDTKLTRLFSSGKEDDFTKIGRFGIGFVSVFAIHPDAV
ncbi:MAG: ATP-binding protein, partial [Acidobacteriota bacterium]